MDGMQDKTKPVNEGSKQTGPKDNEQDQAAREQVGSKGEAGVAGDAAAKAHEDYQAWLAERDAKIKALEGEIDEAAKTAEGAEALRKEMDEPRRPARRACRAPALPGPTSPRR